MSLLSQLRDYELRMRREGAPPTADGEPGERQGMPFMYALQNVRWEVRLNGAGALWDVLPLSSGKTKGRDLGKAMSAPNLVRTVGIKPRLLMDNAEYALGLAKKENDPKTVTRHEAFKALVLACAETTGESAVRAVANFLTIHDAATFEEYLPSGFAPDLNVMFSVDGVNPLDLPSVQKFWGDQFAAVEIDNGGFQAECLITGDFGPVMEREPVKIKGIMGGQTSGMNFISANAAAFESYGLEASQIAPVKFEVAEQYANGLNRLLADSSTSMKTGGVTYAYWAKEGATLPIAELLTSDELDLAALGLSSEPAAQRAESQQIGAALRSPGKGSWTDFDPKTAFYTVGMTPSGSRIAVRSHLTSTAGDVVGHLREYFAAQRLQPIYPDRDPTRYPLYTLVSGLYRDARKEHTESDVDALVQFALTGRPLPRSLLVKLAGRNRVDEHHVTRPRAVLTKMVLLSQEFKELDMDKETLDALNVNQKEPAYHLGRLLAVLDDIQTSAMRGVNTTLVDRFYGSMSTTPYAVMGRLIQGSQAHLQKLRKDNEVAYRAKQNEMESVLSRLADVPAKPLSTAQQALFALGYYHQRAHISAGIRERSAAKKEKEAQAKKDTAQPTLLTAEGDK